MSVNTPLFRMVERLVGGDLCTWLASRRTPGPSWRSWEAIKADLRADFGAEVDAKTLRLWAEELGIPDRGKVA